MRTAIIDDDHFDITPFSPRRDFFLILGAYNTDFSRLAR